MRMCMHVEYIYHAYVYACGIRIHICRETDQKFYHIIVETCDEGLHTRRHPKNIHSCIHMGMDTCVHEHASHSLVLCANTDFDTDSKKTKTQTQQHSFDLHTHMHTYTPKCIYTRFLSYTYTFTHTQVQAAKTAAAAAAQIRRTKLRGGKMRRQRRLKRQMKRKQGHSNRQRQKKSVGHRRRRKRGSNKSKTQRKRNKSKNKESGKLKTSTKRARWQKLGGVKRYVEINCKEEAKRKPYFFEDLQRGSRRKRGEKTSKTAGKWKTSKSRQRERWTVSREGARKLRSRIEWLLTEGKVYNMLVQPPCQVHLF